MYELCYIATTVGLFGALTIFLTIDLLYFGITLYTVALYDELIHMLKVFGKQSHTFDWRKRYQQLRGFVIFHNHILEYNNDYFIYFIVYLTNITCRFIHLGNSIFSPIIFVQFVYGLFVLVTNVLAASYVSGLVNICLHTFRSYCSAEGKFCRVLHL